MSYVVVTGGAGFIGSATCEVIAREGFKVVVVDNLYSGSLSNVSSLLSSGKAIFVKANVSNLGELTESLRTYLADTAGIVHLAALVNIVEVLENPIRALEVNVMGTLNVLELARKYDVARVVYASSVAVYGEPKYLPIDEEHPKNPANLYGLTKLMGEELLWRYHEDYGIKPIALRYFNVYGPRMRPGPYAGVIHKFITALLKGEPPTIYGDGEQTRDFVYVYDVAEANLKALKSDYVGALNIGTGVETSINKLYEVLSNLLGTSIEPRRAPPRKGDVRRSCANNKRAREVLSWIPKTRLESGLLETIRYYRESPALSP